MATSPATEGPPLRVDAQRNLARILAAAREVFAERGIEGSVEEIARRAEVGVGTIYRRFPTKNALIDAIIEERFGQLAVIMERHLADQDAWRGFREMLRETMAQFAGDRAFRRVMDARFEAGDRPPPVADRLWLLVSQIVERAQASGELRADFDTADAALIFGSVGHVMEETRETAPRTWERHLSMVIDGLHSKAATPLPVGPISEDELFAAKRADGANRGRC